MLDAIIQEGLELPPSYPDKWVVDCKSVGTGEKALVYLGRYLYRGVIQEKDIIACQDGQVTFRYQDSKTQKMRTRTVSGATFLCSCSMCCPKGSGVRATSGFCTPTASA